MKSHSPPIARAGRRWRVIWVAAFAIATSGCRAQTQPMPSGGAPPPPPRSAPAPSAEVATLLEQLVSLAASTRGEDQAALGRRLGETKTLDQLDEPAVRDRARPDDLRVARVINRLRENTSTNATQTFEALTRSEAFNASWLRSELLVRALATRHPLPTGCLAFLDAQAQPDSVNLHLAIDALCENDSEAAWTLVGRKLTDGKIEPEFKIAWLRGPILVQRRSPAMLNAAGKWLVAGDLERDLRNALAEALFDYQPEAWYPGREGLPRPPAERSTTAEAATVLRRIGKSVLAGDYPASVQAAVRRTLGKLP
jgi:hypothetical protein